MKRGALLVTGSLVVVLGAAGCGSVNPNGPGAPAAAGVGDHVGGVLTVRADSSLREVFDQAASETEQVHPNLHVRVSYVSSGTVPAADVVATASRSDLDRLHAAQAVGQPSTFAREVLTLAVAPGNPGHVATLRDLDRPGVSVAVCRSSAECGSAADALLERAKVQPARVERVADTAAALEALRAGRVDAGLVWASDVVSAIGGSAGNKSVQMVQLSADPQENIRLTGLGSHALLVATSPSGNTAGASAFVEQLRSPSGQRELRAYGYR